MLQSLRQATAFLALITLLTGGLYPAAVTGLGQLLFPAQAGGSLVLRDGRVIGSALIAQGFAGAGYFAARPSAGGHDAGNSGGTNLGVGNAALNRAVAQRVAALQRDGRPLPADLVTSSGSGLDPHLSPAAALYQVPRVAAARGLPAERVEALVRAQVEPRQLGFLGEPRVNVLQLNLALDAASR